MTMYNTRALVLERGAKRHSRWTLGPVKARLATALRRTNDAAPRAVDGPLAGTVHDEPEMVAEHLLPRFPVARRGYDRAAVDEYVAELELELAALDRELADVRGGSAMAAEVAIEIKRVGEQTSAVLIAAHQQREEILSRAREDAERCVADAERCVADATATANALTAECEGRLRELEAQTEAAQRERERLLDDLRTISTALAGVAASADERIPAG